MYEFWTTQWKEGANAYPACKRSVECRNHARILQQEEQADAEAWLCQGASNAACVAASGYHVAQLHARCTLSE